MPPVPSPTVLVPDIYTLAKPLALWLFGIMGTLGMIIGTASFGFAWSANERMTKVETLLEERSKTVDDRLKRMEAQNDKILDKLDKIKNGP